MLLLAFLLPLLLVESVSAIEPGLDAAFPASQGLASSSIAAQDILDQIRSGEPLAYDNVTIAGQLDLGLLDGPVKQSIRITNSLFLGNCKNRGSDFR